MKTRRYLCMALAALMAACTQPGESGHEAQQDDDHGHEQELTLTAAQMQAVEIALGKIEQRELGQANRVNGELALNPQDRAEATSIVSGNVRRIAVTEGQHVAKGQVLAWVENTQMAGIQKEYLVAQKQLELARMEVKRQQMLAAGGAGIQKNMQQATASLEMAQANISALSQQLSQLGISPGSLRNGKMVNGVAVTAPISGTVGKINVASGSYVDSSTPLMSIANHAAVFVRLNVFESAIAALKVGQAVDMTLTNDPARELSGRVYQIGKEMDPETKSVPVFVRLTGRGSGSLIAGMSVSAVINSGKALVPAVPSGAVVAAEGKNYIFVVDHHDKKAGEYHFAKVEVATGVSELGYTQITPMQALPADATVVVDNAFYLASMGADHGEH